MMDRAILKGGVNLIDTAEQCESEIHPPPPPSHAAFFGTPPSPLPTAASDPIPSDKNRPEGSSEALVGDWLKKGTGRRKEIVIATKVGVSNIATSNKQTTRYPLGASNHQPTPPPSFPPFFPPPPHQPFRLPRSRAEGAS